MARFGRNTTHATRAANGLFKAAAADIFSRLLGIKMNRKTIATDVTAESSPTSSRVPKNGGKIVGFVFAPWKPNHR